MIIRKLTASFGKLENDSLSFHDGLNVIYAPNESGKSTWCAFIRAMLYGVDSSERARSGYLPDKLRYAPWSGSPMEGSMELTADHCDITISRSTHAKGAPMREFTAVYTGTNVPVEGMNGQNAGELLTGVSKDVFRRSAFIAQGAVGVSGSPELEKRISAIVTTGEEQGSFSEAEDRLKSWQHKRRFNRRGMLPELEGKMDELQRRLDDMGSDLDDVQRLEEQLEQSRQDCSRLEAAVTDSRRRQRRQALDSLSAGREELAKAGEEHDEALLQLSRSREALRDSQFGELSLKELDEQIGADRVEYRALGSSLKSSKALIPALLCFLLAVGCAAWYSVSQLLAPMIGAAVLCVAAIVLLLRYSQCKQAAQQARSRRQQILKRYQAKSLEEMNAVLTRHEELLQAVEEAQGLEEQARTAYESLRKRQEGLEQQTIHELDFTAGDSEAARLSRTLTARRAEAERLSAQIENLRGRLSALGDPLVLQSSLNCMQEEYGQIQSEYEAITLALESLRQADEQLQSRFSPELGSLAAQYMSAMTGGRYEDLFLNRDFSARIRSRDDAVARDSEYLSAGTLDLMYLAVRLAVCELALPDGEPCPLIIDDALVNLDEKRTRQAMELLSEISRERQVIVFTCRKPETGDAESAE